MTMETAPDEVGVLTREVTIEARPSGELDAGPLPRRLDEHDAVITRRNGLIVATGLVRAVAPSTAIDLLYTSVLSALGGSWLDPEAAEVHRHDEHASSVAALD
jgi:hypothetical protein